VKNIILIFYITVCFFISRSMAQDYATEHTQILNNVELIVNAERQLQSLLNQAQMIENQIEQLKSIATEPVTVLVQLDGMRAQLFDLINEGINLSGQIQNQLDQMKQEAQDIATRPNFDDRINVVVQGSDSVIQATLDRIGKSRQSYQAQETELQGLVAKSQSAVGQTQTLQVLNQVAAANVTQMQATQEALHDIATLQATKMTQDNQKEEAEETVLNQEIHPAVNQTSSFDFGST